VGLFRKLRDTFRPHGLGGEIEDEFQFHLEQRVADLVAQGVPEAEARRVAARMFGNRAHLADSTRDRDVLAGLQSILQDVRFAVRNLRRSPTFTAVAVLSLAFGIGVNAAIFTLVDGILLEKLPVSDPQRIVQVHGHTKEFDNNRFNVPVLRELQSQHEIFAEVIGFYASPVRIDLGGELQNVRAEFAASGYFRFFRARPALGRLLNDDDTSVCVLSYDAWQNLFGEIPRSCAVASARATRCCRLSE
jgi:hypothetical protein